MAIKVGAVGYPLRIQFYDGDGSVRDVSGATVSAIITRPDGSSVERNMSFVTDGTDGLCEITSIATDFPDPGIYELGGRIQSGGVDWYTAETTEILVVE